MREKILKLFAVIKIKWRKVHKNGSGGESSFRSGISIGNFATYGLCLKVGNGKLEDCSEVSDLKAAVIIDIVCVTEQAGA